MSKPTGKKTETQAKTWLTPEQVDRVRDAAMRNGATYLQDRNETIISTLADTGLRVSELVALNWNYLDLDAEPAELMLPSEIQKGDPGAAYLDLGRDAARQLRRYQRSVWKDSPAVFPSRQSERMTDRSVRNVVKNAAAAAEVRPHLISGGRGEPADVSPHTFRHSIAFRMVRREGKRLEDVMLRLRHANLKTTDQVYGHLRRR